MSKVTTATECQPCARCGARFGEPPGVALVAAGEAVEAGVPVRVSATVRPGNVWLGRAE